MGNCSNLGAVGSWQNITPPAVWNGIGKKADYGVFAFAVDQSNVGTVYLGTVTQGIWKTTDCGSTWTHIDTGRGGANLDPGMEWTFAIDPVNPETVYTNAGYGFDASGLFKSTNGGVDWDPIWPPSDPQLSAAFEYNFANTVAIDPSPGQHLHLLLTFHERCKGHASRVCIAESFNGGATWRLLDGDKRWTSDGEGIKIFFLEDSKTWLWMSQDDGLWRSKNGGASWAQLTAQNANHLQATNMYRTNDGTFYVAGMGDLWRSPKGTSEGTWTAVPNLGPLPGGVTGDGTTMYLSLCYYDDFCNANDTAPYYLSAPESTGVWTAMPAPATNHVGGVLGFDRSHHVLYSSNIGRGGFWRMVTK